MPKTIIPSQLPFATTSKIDAVFVSGGKTESVTTMRKDVQETECIVMRHTEGERGRGYWLASRARLGNRSVIPNPGGAGATSVKSEVY